MSASSDRTGPDSQATLPVAGGHADPAPEGCLVFVAAAVPEDQGRSVELTAEGLVIGRDEDCGLRLNDASVSRHHARLSITPGGISVEDLGSTNGITYLGKRIERVTLQLGARIEVGACSLDLLPPRGSRSLPVSERTGYGELVGSSLAMRRLYATLQLLEHSDAPVLIEGETGTGKELVARALHQQGQRASKPLVIIDCGNVPAELMESELFGHRKGAFTGAVGDRAGAFEAANGGTVFLDELGELPLGLQPKLLRVLETGQIKRLGDATHQAIDVRVIAATRRDLVAEAAAGRFREDLYFRVAVVHLSLPPLRERREDIPDLARHLAERCGEARLDGLPPEAVELFMRHDWPGNVRELRNAVQRTLALGIVDVGEPGARTGPAERGEDDFDYRSAREQALSEFERGYLERLIARFEGNVSAAARAAGVDRKHIRELLKKHGLY